MGGGEIDTGTDKEKTSGHNPERREERRQNKSSSFIVPSPRGTPFSFFYRFLLSFFYSSSLTIESNAQTDVRCNREVYPKKDIKKIRNVLIIACSEREQIDTGC